MSRLTFTKEINGGIALNFSVNETELAEIAETYLTYKKNKNATITSNSKSIDKNEDEITIDEDDIPLAVNNDRTYSVAESSTTKKSWAEEMDELDSIRSTKKDSYASIVRKNETADEKPTENVVGNETDNEKPTKEIKVDDSTDTADEKPTEIVVGNSTVNEVEQPMRNIKTKYLYADNQIIFGGQFMHLLSVNGPALGEHVDVCPSTKVEYHDPRYFSPPVGDNFNVFIIHGMTPNKWKIAKAILFNIVVKSRTSKSEINVIYNHKPMRLNVWFFAFDKKHTSTFSKFILTPFLTELNKSIREYNPEHEFIEENYYHNGFSPMAYNFMIDWNKNYIKK